MLMRKVGASGVQKDIKNEHKCCACAGQMSACSPNIRMSYMQADWHSGVVVETLLCFWAAQIGASVLKEMSS